MPRHNQSMEGIAGGACKIRKRGCLSSSSSSSVLQNNRFKRAIMVAKRGGSTTPVPTWKMNARSPSSVVGFSDLFQYQPSCNSGKGGQAPVSARKLANALWGMNKIPSPQMSGELQYKASKKESTGRSRMERSLQPVSLPPHLSDPSHSPVSDISYRSRSSSQKRVMPVISQKLRYNKCNHRASRIQRNASFMEIETCSQGLTPTTSAKGIKSRLKNLSNGLMTSKELLKVLNHIWGLEKHHLTSVPVVSALRAELDQACLQVDQLIQEQRSEHNESSYMRKQFAEEKLAWKNKEQERIIAASINSIMEELESEKKLRRRAERLNKKLGLELTSMRSLLSKATLDLENERRAREITEQVCNELVRGIGEDKAEVEEMKRESAKVREELEKEREMLQLADVWREERVQMKLTEAKFHFEEKNAAVEQLRNELEAFLTVNRAKEINGDSGKPEVEDHKDADQNADERDETGEVEDGRNGEEEEENDGTGSSDSDLHSIELNMESNNRTYSWSYATGSGADEGKFALAGQKNEVTGSNKEKILRGRLSLDRGTSEEITWNLRGNFQQSGIELEQPRTSDGQRLLDNEAQKLDEDAERYITVKGLRDNMLAGSKIATARALGSPRHQWDKLQNWKDYDDQISEASKVDEVVRALRDSGSKERLLGNNNASGHGRLRITPVM